MRAAVAAELLAHVFAAAVAGEGSGRVERAADGGVRFIGEEGLGVAVIPGQGDAEPGCEGCCLGAACFGSRDVSCLSFGRVEGVLSQKGMGEGVHGRFARLLSKKTCA